jgi:hypothetical protein
VLLALIPGGGHCAVLTQPDAILAHLRAEVAPLAATVLPGANLRTNFHDREDFCGP